VKGGDSYKPLTIVGLNDFHGQIDQTTLVGDNGISSTVGGGAALATMFDEEFANLPKPGCCSRPVTTSARRRRTPACSRTSRRSTSRTSGASTRPRSATTSSTSASRASSITSIGANFPFLATNVIENSTGELPDWLQPSKVFTINGTKVGVIGAELQSTPELVSAGATAGLTFQPEGPAIKAESQRLKALGVKVQIVVIHQGTAFGSNPIGQRRRRRLAGPILGIANQLQDTTVDAMIVGHTHRISNLMQGHILITEGINAGTSYSVLQLMLKGGDVAWAGGATRVAKNIGVARRADVQAVVDAREHRGRTDPQPGRRRAGARHPPRSDPAPRVGDGQPRRRRDAREIPRGRGGLHELGRPPADLPCNPPSGNEGPCVITLGELFGVLPFGNATVILTLTGAQMKTAFLNGFSPFCNPAINTGRFPQIAGLRATFHCSGTTAVVDGVWKTPEGQPEVALGDGDTVRFVTNDFMYTGGDGYTIFAQGTNVKQTGDLLLDVAADYIEANQPVDPVVEGRITGP
jgi:2',3'-cyclic-nucleotide 2'-phosphodiesterase (5'-nucleotidase family)